MVTTNITIYKKSFNIIFKINLNVILFEGGETVG